MRKDKKEITGQFKAKTADGRIYVIIEVTRSLNHETVSDTGEIWKGHSQSFQLQNGHPVEHISGNVYEIVSTGEKVTRIL